MQYSHTNNPATLVAIIVAARRSNNRELERVMRHQLKQQFRVKLNFIRDADCEKGATPLVSAQRNAATN